MRVKQLTCSSECKSFRSMSVAFSFNVLTATVVTPSLPAIRIRKWKKKYQRINNENITNIRTEKYIYVQKSNIKVQYIGFIKTRSDCTDMPEKIMLQCDTIFDFSKAGAFGRFRILLLELQMQFNFNWRSERPPFGIRYTHTHTVS